MNEITRLKNNIITLINANALEENLRVFEDEECETIEELNELIEYEISYWTQDCERFK